MDNESVFRATWNGRKYGTRVKTTFVLSHSKFHIESPQPDKFELVCHTQVRKKCCSNFPSVTSSTSTQHLTEPL